MQGLKTPDLNDVVAFLRHNAEKMETAELSIRRSAGAYVSRICPTNEPPISS